jgi:hypothetical protein
MSLHKLAFTIAHSIKNAKALINKSWGFIVSLAWKRAKVIFKLRSGVVNFSYSKKDGSERSAKGTLAKRRLSTLTFKGSTAASNPFYLKYFDLGKQAWRSFKLENFIKFN